MRNKPFNRRPLVDAFTIVELMISIAISLLLIVGVNKVFQITAKTVGGGESMAGINRDDRAAHAVFTTDFRNMVITNAPFLIIKSGQVYAFRNPLDRDGSIDPGDPSKDSAYANATPANIVPAAMTNSRSHRIDDIRFFVRDLYFRQTSGSSSQFATTDTSNEAYIALGFAAIPNNQELGAASYTYGNYKNPGEMPGNDNNFYAADWILARIQMLMEPNATPAIAYYPKLTGPNTSGAVDTLGDSSFLESAHFDVVGTSIQNLYTQLSPPSVSSVAQSPNWFAPFINFRYQVNPFTIKPITPAAAAKTAPIFIRGCSQFIVEFAGNYITEDVRGVMTSPTPSPDGKIDFVIDRTGARKVRWYGFPRDTNGDGVIDSTNDVVPLRDILGAPADVESFANFPPTSPDYMTTVKSSPGSPPSYTVAWGPNSTTPLPKLIRITLAIEDHNGRLNDAQRFEYIVPVSQ